MEAERTNQIGTQLVDLAARTPGGIRVAGWSLDPNTAQTPGMDRKAAIDFARADRPRRQRFDVVLDLAGGTGDLARLFAGCVGPTGHVLLTDINGAMLSAGRDKLLDAGVAHTHQGEFRCCEEGIGRHQEQDDKHPQQHVRNHGTLILTFQRA